MANFPMGGVLRGFMPSTYYKYASDIKPLPAIVRLSVDSGEAGGLVRIDELLNIHKNRCEIPPFGGADQKNPSFLNTHTRKTRLIKII